MKPSISISGSNHIISLAKQILEEIAIPEGIDVRYIHHEHTTDYVDFLKNIDAYRFGPTNLLICGMETSKFIHDHGRIPSIPIRITGFDLLNAIHESLLFSPEITIIATYPILSDIGMYEKLLKIRIHQFIVDPNDSTQALTDALKSSGCKAVIGSSIVCNLAEQNGIKGIFLYSKSEVYNALKQAIDTISAYLRETERAEMLKAVVDYANSGIIGTDRHFRITTFNPAAEKVLGMKASTVMGKPFHHVFPEFSLPRTKNTTLPKINEPGKIRGRSIVFNSLPINVKSQAHGQVTVLHDIASIRTAEARIRRDLFQKRFVAQHCFEDIAGRSEVICKTVKKARVFAGSDSPLLIIGETGTGKELFAQSVHNACSRKDNPFVSINCGALTESLLDSELFGYEKGAFTGARQEGKTGLFEMAHMGTIFLDEIGDISPAVQVRLLRVLQEKEIMRIGGTRLIPVDVRVIAATNRDLWSLVETGKFREDLFYRLNVLELKIPSLRDRLSDIPELVRTFLIKKALSVNTNAVLEAFTPPVTYAWPGNVRELENVLERFCALASDYQPSRENYAQLLDECFVMRMQTRWASSGIAGQKRRKINGDEIAMTIDEMNGNKTTAARRMGISRTTLYRKIREQHQQK